MYQGEDLILAMGAPGSRWSGAIRILSLMYENINTSDNNNEWNYEKSVSYNKYLQATRLKDRREEPNRQIKVGWHRGAYWGPGNPAGDKFDILDTLTKEEIIEEFKKPFANWESGIKIIKSHWFSYHIPLLRELFPKAILWSFYDTDKICQEWWHTVGGWEISYPNYDWYKDDETMLKQIGIENNNIKDNFNLKRYTTWKETVKELGFPVNIRTPAEIIDMEPKFIDSFKPSMYSNSKNFNKFLDSVFSRKKMGIINPTL